MTWYAWPNDIPTLILVAIAMLAFAMMLTHKRKVVEDPTPDIRRSVQRLFEFAVKKDYQAAASLLARSEDEVLRYSQEPEVVEERCRPLQELAGRGGVSIDKLVQQGPDFVCEIHSLGAARTVTTQTWRFVKGRWALAPESAN